MLLHIRERERDSGQARSGSVVSPTMKSLVSLTFLILSVSSCPEGWISGGGSCYFMSPENMNFLTAQQVKIWRRWRSNWLFNV